MKNNIALPLSESDGTENFGTSSRKRKLIAADVENKSRNHFHYELNQPQGSSFSWISGPRRSDQSPPYPAHSTESNTIRNQFQMDQYHSQNYSLESCSPASGNLHRIVSNSPFTMSSQFCKHESNPPLYKMPVRKAPELVNRAMDVHNKFDCAENSSLSSLTRSCIAPVENSHVEMGNLVNYGMKHGTLSMSLENGKLSSESLRSIDPVQRSLCQVMNFRDGYKPRTRSEKAYNSGSPCESRMTSEASKDSKCSTLPSEGAYNLGAVALERGNMPLQNVMRSDASSDWAEKNSGIEEQGHRENDIGFVKDTTTAEKDMKHPFIEESVKDGGMPMTSIEPAHSSKLNTGSSKLLEGYRSSPAKASPLVREKLWEGSLQLNSSVTARVVAFYKSGERLLDVNWSECVEVKGKVRLEAFEKYIQDLPRSRTRGLMVISLCWKKGSAVKELKCMKEFAKGYRRSERVGFAKLSPVIDIYLCPPSEKIIRILAKYRFFKGLAAGEDKSELLLGCVVWRKNQGTSGHVGKKSETTGAVEENSGTLSVVKRKSENGDFLLEQNLKDPSEGSNNSVAEKGSAYFLPAASVQTVVPISCGKQKPGFSRMLKGYDRLREMKTLCEEHPKLEQSKASTELPKAVIPFPYTAIKLNMPVGDDDDLPEFDFQTSCEIPPTSVRRIVQPKGIHISEWSGLHMSLRNTIPLATPKSSLDETNEKLFSDDDDDMPEWLPPKPRIQSSTEANKPLASFNVISQDHSQRLAPPPHNSVLALPPHHPSAPLPPPPPPLLRPDYPSKGFLPVDCQPASIRVPPPVPIQSRPRLLSGFSYMPALQPVSGSSAVRNLPVPGNYHRWRPS